LLDRFEAYLGRLGFFSQPQIWATLREVVTLTQNIMKEAGEQVFLQDPQTVTFFLIGILPIRWWWRMCSISSSFTSFAVRTLDNHRKFRKERVRERERYIWKGERK